MQNKLAVILVVWKKTEEALPLIGELLQWRQLEPLVVVVENEADRTSFDHISHPRFLNICLEKNTGYGGGNNAGIKEALARGMDFALLLNTDASVPELTVMQLLAALRNRPDLFSIGPKMIEGTGSNTKEYIGGKNIAHHINTRREWHEIPPGQRSDDLIPCDYTPGAILLLDLKKTLQTGLFDETFFFSGEVADLCYRANRLGFLSATLTKVTGQHFTEENPLRRGMYIYYNFRNRFLFVKKHRLGVRPRLFWTKTMAIQLAHYIVSGNWTGVRAVLLALAHAVFGIYGNQNEWFVERAFDPGRKTN